MKKIPAILLYSFCLILLSACGQTGPLYLPDDSPKKSSTTAQ